MSKVAWFFIGLIVVGIICGMVLAIEQLTKPPGVVAAEQYARWFRELPRDVQRGLAILKGKSIDELSKDPYDDWAPKVSIGLLSAYGFAWVIYLAYSFFRFVDREGSNNPPTQQLLL